MIAVAYKCESCGADRGCGNHWLELRWIKSAPYVLAWSKAAEKPGSKHICGESCAHQVLGAHLAALREKAKGTV